MKLVQIVNELTLRRAISQEERDNIFSNKIEILKEDFKASANVAEMPDDAYFKKLVKDVPEYEEKTIRVTPEGCNPHNGTHVLQLELSKGWQIHNTEKVSDTTESVANGAIVRKVIKTEYIDNKPTMSLALYLVGGRAFIYRGVERCNQENEEPVLSYQSVKELEFGDFYF